MKADNDRPRISRTRLAIAGCVVALGILLVLEIAAYLVLSWMPSMGDPWSGGVASRSLLTMEKDLNVVAQRQRLYVEDRSLFWRLAPNVEMQVENAALETRGEPLRWTIRTNGEGFRGPSATSAGSSLRILAMGDSSTFGYRVNEDEVYAARLSAACAGSAGTSARVFNAGVPGYTSYQGKTLLPSLLTRYRPEVVTIAFGTNDHNEDSLADADRGAWVDSGLGRLAYAAGRLNLSRLLAGLARPQASGDAGSRLPQPERVNLAAYRANIEEMIALARGSAARVVLVNLAFHTPLHRYALQELATRLNVPYLDGTLLFDEMYGRIEQGAAYPEQVKAWLAFYDSQVSAVRQVYFTREFYETHYTTEREWRKFVTLMADPIHPNAIGHLVLSDALAPLVCPPGAPAR